MQVIVNPHTITINKTEIVNEGEYNIQSCEFQFSEEFIGLSNIAVFTGLNGSYKVALSGNTCIIPIEVLQNEEVITLGVYAYDMDGEELVLRYSPTPDVFTVEPGSYVANAQNSSAPTPTEVEQLQSQITQNSNDIDNLEEITGNHTSQIETLQNDVSNIKEEQITQNTNIETNSNDIADIKAEQLIQNENISQNANNITSLGNDLSDEVTNRQNADNNLQSQIDAITVSSDVIDVLGTYQDLVNYDTSHVKANDIIKVLQDSTHNNAIAYYRWVITQHVGAWIYVGSEGPYYTKSETDTLLQNKANANDVYTKAQIDTTLESYATKTDIENFVTEQEVDTKLENYVSNETFTTSQNEQNVNIQSNTNDINWLETIVNQMPTVSGTGTDLSLQDVLNYRLMKFLPQGSSSQKNNLFNNDIVQGGISEGIDVTASNRVKTEGYIEVIPNTDIAISFTGCDEYFVSLFDNGKSFVSGYGWRPSGNSVSIPANIYYIRLTFRKTDNSNITPNSISNIQIGNIPNPDYPYPV